MLLPIVHRQAVCDLFQLAFQRQRLRYTKRLCQRRLHRRFIVVLHLPQVDRTGISPCAGIRHIENIAQSGIVAAAVNEGDPPGTALYIAVHPLIPEVVFRTRCRVRPLGEDHQLILIGIFVQTGGGGQKPCPLANAGIYSAGSVPRHLRINL